MEPAGYARLEKTVAGLNAVVMLGSLTHAAPSPEKAAELSLGGLVALTRAPLAVVAWNPAPEPTAQWRLASRCAGGTEVTDVTAVSLRRFCGQLPELRISHWDGPGLPTELRRIGTEELLAIPLRFSAECLGFLLVGGPAGSLPTDLTLLRALGAQTSSALYLARLRESEASRLDEVSTLAGEFRTQGELLARALRLQEALIDLVLSGENASAIVEHLASQIGAPIWLLDTNRALLARAPSGVADNCAPRESELERILGNRYADHEPHSVSMGTSTGMRSFLVQSVATDRETFGYLVAGSTELGAVDRTAFQGGRLVLVLRLLIERTVADAEERAGRDLLHDALRSAAGPPVEALATRLGYEADGPATVLALQIHPRDERTSGARFRDVAAVVLAELRTDHRGVAGTLGTEIVAILRPDMAEQNVRRVLERAGDGEVWAGVSDVRHCLGDLQPAYREALAALTVAQRRQVSMLRFADLGLHRLLFDVDHAERTDDHVERWLGPLLRYDDTHDGELVATLRAFLAASTQQQAAGLLSVHLSTLKYRLGRIREILDVDLTDPDTRFDIELALRLHRNSGNGRPPR